MSALPARRTLLAYLDGYLTCATVGVLARCPYETRTPQARSWYEGRLDYLLDRANGLVPGRRAVKPRISRPI